MLLSNLKASCPDFQGVYQNHFQSAKFDTVLRRNRDFEARKLGLVSARHLLEKHRRLSPEKRVQLIQSLLNGDFDGAHGILQETKRFSTSTVLTIVASPFNGFFSSPRDSPGGALKKEMKAFTARLSDSQFLLDMKGVHEEALQPIIQDIEALSHALLSSSIDITVGAMAREVAEIQQDASRRTIQHDFENEEMKLQNKALREFIHRLNTCSAARKELWVHFDLIKYE
jgi:hypothetical protein